MGRNAWRNLEMTALRKDGMPLETIGQRYGLTRERVRQITSAEVSAVEARKARGKEWLTEDKVAAAVMKHRSLTIAAEDLGVCPAAVSVFVRKRPELNRMWRGMPFKVTRGGARRRPETEAASKKAYDLRASGLSYGKIAKQIGKQAPAEARRLVLMIGPDPLNRTINKHKTKMTDAVVAAAKVLHLHGMPKKDISALFGVSHGHLSRSLP